jgi:hypothetical protein
MGGGYRIRRSRSRAKPPGAARIGHAGPRATKAEVEAREALLQIIEPNRLRGLVQDVIERHLPAEQFELLTLKHR